MPEQLSREDVPISTPAGMVSIKDASVVQLVNIMQGCLAELVKRNAALDARYGDRVAAGGPGRPGRGGGNGGSGQMARGRGERAHLTFFQSSRRHSRRIRA